MFPDGQRVMVAPKSSRSTGKMRGLHFTIQAPHEIRIREEKRGVATPFTTKNFVFWNHDPYVISSRVQDGILPKNYLVPRAKEVGLNINIPQPYFATQKPNVRVKSSGAS